MGLPSSVFMEANLQWPARVSDKGPTYSYPEICCKHHGVMVRVQFGLGKPVFSHDTMDSSVARKNNECSKNVLIQDSAVSFSWGLA